MSEDTDRIFEDKFQIAISKAASALRFRAKHPDFHLTEPAKNELRSIAELLAEFEGILISLKVSHRGSMR